MNMFKLLGTHLSFGMPQHRWSGGIFCLAWAVGILLLVAPFAAAQKSQVSPEIVEKFRMASEAMRAGNIDAAGEGFAAIVRESPNFAEGYLNVGLVREEQGRHGEAIANFQKALRLKPGLRGANLFMGIAEYRTNQLDAALAALRKETLV